jgi:hypothetical protein
MQFEEQVRKERGTFHTKAGISEIVLMYSARLPQLLRCSIITLFLIRIVCHR